MYSASDYRSMARRALKNYWWLAVGVTLLASILGVTSSGFTPSFSLTVNGNDLTQYYPEALRHALRIFLPVSGIISLAQFVIGGARESGWRAQSPGRPQPLLPEAGRRRGSPVRGPVFRL